MPTPPPLVTGLLTLLALALACAALVLATKRARLANRQWKAAVERDQAAQEIERRCNGALPTLVTVTRDGVEHPCTWVRFVAVLPAELGAPLETDTTAVSPPLPPRTELTLLSCKDVRVLFEVDA